jgi:hypothetical protein
MATVSFAKDVAPILKPFRDYMIWRFDLTSYDDVVASSKEIFSRISYQGMPPPGSGYDPLTEAQIETFRTWIKEGFPP